MVVIAGPPGGGKSTIFPISQFGVDYFNADDRAAQLNRGSYHKISEQIRSRVNLEFQRWVLDHIEGRRSFAIETTHRSPITLEQARLARSEGFWTTMRYVSAGSVEESVKRVVQRSYRGGHSASERLWLPKTQYQYGEFSNRLQALQPSFSVEGGTVHGARGT